MPTIAVETWVKYCHKIIEDKNIHGPVHMVQENIRHETYIRNIAKQLHRPVRLRIPEKIIRFILGEGATLVTGSWHIQPWK